MTPAAEAAAKFGCSVKTVQRALRNKQIPGVIVGTVYLVNAGWLASVTSWPPVQEMAS